jgi:MFS family permease
MLHLSNNSPASDSIWTPTFISLCIVNIFQITGQMMMNTVIPLYVRSLGATGSIIGMVVGAFAITALCTRPVITPLFDSFPKKPIFFAAVLLIVVCSFLYSFATSVPAMFAIRMLHGLAMGCTGPLALALASESLPIEHRASGISIFSLAQALGQAVGPALGLWLIDLVGYSWTFNVAGISMGIAAALVLTIKEPKVEDRPKYKIALNRMFAVGAAAPAVLTAICAACNSSIMSFLAIYGTALGVTGIGLYFTVHAIFLIIFRPLFGRLAESLGYRKVMLPALILYAGIFVMVSQATQLWQFVIIAILAAAGYGVCSPLFQSIAMSSVPNNRSGAASATNFTGLDLAQLVGPTCVGSIADHFCAQTGSEAAGYSTMYLVVAGIMVGGIVLFLLLYPTMQRNMDRVAEENGLAPRSAVK